MNICAVRHSKPLELPVSPAAPQRRDWTQFALLLIDVQHDFWPEPIARHFPAFPAQVSRLLDVCRSEGIEVIHVRAAFQPDGSDWMVGFNLRGTIPCVQGTLGAETLPFARELPGELVVTKRSFDGFLAVELPAHLERKGKRFLLIAGLVTSVCVLFTTASAAQRGFLTAIAEDCCADQPASHTQTLERYAGLVFRRTTVDELLAQHLQWCAALHKLDEQRV